MTAASEASISKASWMGIKDCSRKDAARPFQKKTASHARLCKAMEFLPPGSPWMPVLKALALSVKPKAET